MAHKNLLTKKVETALEIEESLDHLIRLASPTKEKVYRIYRQFREWGYHYHLEDIEKKCEDYYRQMNRFNQVSLIRDIFRIKATSEVASVLALNFRSAKLEFSELNEISTHLMSLMRRVCRPEDFGLDCFLAQVAVKRLTSPNWNNGEIFFSFADFFDALEWASFRRFGSRHHDDLKLLFYSMDPVTNTEIMAKSQCVSDQSDHSHCEPGLDVEQGGIYAEEIQVGEIEKQNDQFAFNENFSVITQVLLQAEYLWIKDLETHSIAELRTAMPVYPLKQESKAKEIRELESQVRLCNSIILLESKINSHFQKYAEIEGILRNTILVNVRSILNVYDAPELRITKIKGPGSQNIIKKKLYVMPNDLPSSDINFLVEQIGNSSEFKWHGEIEYQKFSNLFVLKAKDLYSYFQRSKVVA